MKGLLRRFHTDEQGAIAFLIALLLPVIAGMSAMVFDLSQNWETRRQLQNCADSAALAGAQDLPDAVLTEASAIQYLEDYDNGWCAQQADNYSIEVFDDYNYGGDLHQAVQVTLSRPRSYTLARMIGFQDTVVTAAATAIKGDVLGLQGMEPFSMVACGGPNEADCAYVGPCEGVALSDLYVRNWIPLTDTSILVPLVQDWEYTLKVGAGGNAQVNAGNFQALTIGDAGGNVYRENVAWGANEWVADCDWVNTKPGNNVGPTRQGLQDRIDRDIAHNPLTMYDDVMHNADGIHGGHGPNDSDFWNCPRVLFIPLVGNVQGGGNTDLQIISWGIMFLEEVISQGNTSFVKARFFNPDSRLLPPADWNELGAYDPNSFKPTGVRLIK